MGVKWEFWDGVVAGATLAVLMGLVLATVYYVEHPSVESAPGRRARRPRRAH
ncbi:MAG: hypothetical protein IT365_24365 [Candidatus Hydrogenedentes bacterium]|nr:hypothetical protein [Candidatus Hydrogenedentota bacterium]